MPSQRTSHVHQRNEVPYQRPPSPPPPESRGDEDVMVNNRDPLPTDARQLTRLDAMFWAPRDVLNADVVLRRASRDGSEAVLRATGSDEDKMNFQLRDRLDELQPRLFELLAKQGGHFTRNVRTRLENGRDGAKAEDNGKIKKLICHLREWSPSLLNAPKSSRGLAHPDIAYLLSPITVDWDNEEERRRFVELGKPAATADRWGIRLLYPDGKGNPKKPSEHLLEAQLLVDVANGLLKSPSSVLPAMSIRPGSAKRGRKGIAKKYKMVAVTTGFLAYVAVITRFALSAEESFDEDGGTFNYAQFYREIRQFLERPTFQRRTSQLLKWWNRKIFPNNADYDDGDEDAGDSMTALLEAEFEADGSDEDPEPEAGLG